MATTICLVRHGETDWNVAGRLQGSTNIPLNKTGISQANECSIFLAKNTWDIVITSPLKRAKKTAEMINEKLHLPFIEMEAFMEKSFGDAEGMTVAEREVAFPNRVYPNEEERSLFVERVMNGIGEILEKHREKRMLLVAHGAVINAVLYVLSNGEIGSGITRLHNACLSTIVFQNEKWNIETFNEIGHLTVAEDDTTLIL